MIVDLFIATLDILIKIFSVFIIYVVVTLLWQGAEMLFYGKVTPKFIDDIVALILALSIYINIK